jgi:hypothetical protein
LNFNIQYLSTLLENLVNNDQLNSGDPNVLISKVVNLLLQQSATIDNPFKLGNIPKITAKGIQLEFLKDKKQYKISNYTFQMKPGKYIMVMRVRGIESKRTKVFSVEASIFSVFY